MKKKPEDYLKDPYSRVLLPEEDGRFSAEVLEFPGCFAQGNSPNEAFNNLEEAAKSWIQASLDQGLHIPSPALNQNYSGKISLRIPRSLHKKAAQFAERDATSLNQFLISAIASKIGAEEFNSYLFDKIERLVTHTVGNAFFLQTNVHNNFLELNRNNIPLLQEACNKEVISYAGNQKLYIQP